MENKYKEILSQIITPSYLFDVDAFKDRCFEIKEIVGENVDLCYSMKANPFLIEFLPDCIQASFGAILCTAGNITDRPGMNGG